jgi:hypothetical protein
MTRGGPVEEDETLSALLDAYLRQDEDTFWAVETMIDEDPERCWRFLEQARRRDFSTVQLAYISAGPFEDLMSRHGAAFIDRVELAARQDATMRVLVATVWKGGMAPEIWARIEGLRARLGIKPL